MNDELPKVVIAPGTKPVYSAGNCIECALPLSRGWTQLQNGRVCEKCRIDYMNKVNAR